jgi:putative peptidoglycan lipid II flippase
MAALLAQQGAMAATILVSNHSGGTGTFVLFSYINAVYLLPYGVLAVTVATVTFPALSAWVGRSKDTEATEADRTAAAEKTRQLTSTITALMITIGFLGALILITASGPLETFFAGIDAAKEHSTETPFGSMAPAIMVMGLAVPGWSFVAWGTRVFYALERSRYSATATTVGWILVIVGMLGAVLVSGANGDAGMTLISICIGYAVGMSVAGGLLLVSMQRVLGPGGLARVGRRGLLSLVAAVIGSVAGVAASKWLAGRLGTSALEAVANGVISALLGCVLFAVIVMIVDRHYLGEVRGVLADRKRSDGGQNPVKNLHTRDDREEDS